MKRLKHLSDRFFRLASVVVLVGSIAAAGCDSGGNVLKPPEGGSTVNEAKPAEVKPKPNISSRHDREKEQAH